MSLRTTFAHLFHPRRSNNHRPKILHPEAYVYFVAIVVGFFGLVNLGPRVSQKMGDVLGFASSITPTQVVDQTNQQRRLNGLAPLTVNAKLTQAALAKGQDMMEKDYWAHNSPDGLTPWYFILRAGYQYQRAGENLAVDFSNTSDMVAAWMASPSHRANILNGNFKEIGVAVIDGNFKGSDTTLVVQMFGTRRTTATQGQTAGGSTRGAESSPPASPTVAGATSPTPSATPSVTPSPSPSANPELASVEAAAPEGPINRAQVLAGALLPLGNISTPPLFSPLQLTKAFFLAVIMMIILTLLYDAFVIGHNSTLRLVGKNLAHIFFLTAVAFLIIFFKGGLIR